MTTARPLASVLAGFLCSALIGAQAIAADITGIWSTNTRDCDKVFVRQGAKTSFAQDALLNGSGFIAEGDELRGPTATCRIKRRTIDGAITHMLAACATDIMLSDVQFSVKSVGRDEIVRLFPGMPEISTTYHRCSM